MHIRGCEEDVRQRNVYVKGQHIVYKSPALISQNDEIRDDETKGMQAHISHRLHPTTILVPLACLHRPFDLRLTCSADTWSLIDRILFAHREQLVRVAIDQNKDSFAGLVAIIIQIRLF